MRGDTWLRLRLLRRAPGLAALAVVAGGLITVIAAVLPWQETATLVTVSGDGTRHVVERTAAYPLPMVQVVVLLVGGATLVSGLALARDRASDRIRWWLAAAAVLLAALAAVTAWPGWSGVPTATVDAVADPGIAATLPSGVEAETVHHTGTGTWLLLFAAALTGGATAVPRR